MREAGWKGSCGVIPLAKKQGEWSVFLIQNRGYEEYWSCPKGCLEGEETPQEAAQRELKEETGLEVVRWLSDEPLLEEFYWHYKGERLLKRILFFIAEVAGEVSLPKEEIAHGEWIPLRDAPSKIIYPEGRATLERVLEVVALLGRR